MKRLAALCLLAALPLGARAERLRVDVLVFLNPPSGEELGTAPRHPDEKSAIAIDDVRGLAYAGIALLPENATTLAPEWATLKARRGYTPLLRLSWLQDAPVGDKGPALRVYLPAGDGISGLSGWLRLEGGRALALSADLEQVQTGADRKPLGLRLQQRRSLGMDTLHYLDSTRVGVLARVTAAAR